MAKQHKKVDGLKYVDPDPRRKDPDASYGIVEVPQPDDILYKLTYHKHAVELMTRKELSY